MKCMQLAHLNFVVIRSMSKKEESQSLNETFAELPVTESWDSQQRSSLIGVGGQGPINFANEGIEEEPSPGLSKQIELNPIRPKGKRQGGGGSV